MDPSSLPSPWNRPLLNRSGRASVELVLLCFGKQPVTEWALSAAALGLPRRRLPKGLAFYGLRRADNPETFDLAGASAVQVAGTRQGLPGLDAAAAAALVEEALDCVCIEFPGEAGYLHTDPETLEHAQVAWALAKYAMSQEGALFVLDVQQGRFFNAAVIRNLEPRREFSLAHEVFVVMETRSPEHLGRHLLTHTRGMRKFGRPDLLLMDVQAACPIALHAAQRVLMLIAGRLALGEVVPISTQSLLGISIASRKLKVSLVPYMPGQNAPEANLNNSGLIVTDPGTEGCVNTILEVSSALREDPSDIPVPDSDGDDFA